MKSPYFTNIVIEGPDGTGKTTLYNNLLKYYNYRFCVYDRGEFSCFAFAKKYNRAFASSQRGLPFLYVYLTCSKDKIIERMNKRVYASDEDKARELEKVNDLDLFNKYIDDFSRDYHVIKIDSTYLNEEETLETCVKKIEDYFDRLNHDDPSTFSPWNRVYYEQCDKLGIDFRVINGQPFMNRMPIMVEPNLHNGIFETFSDKTVPHNVIYAQQYSVTSDELTPIIDRKIDFAYIINSKIFTRPEVYEYLNVFNLNNLTCQVGTNQYVSNNPLFKNNERVFGNDYIKLIAKAKASIYIARNIEYLQNITVRIYESIIAGQIVFVDKLSDTNNELLSQIHGNDLDLIDLLYVTPDTIYDNYSKIMSDNTLITRILRNQSVYYTKMSTSVVEKLKKEGLN